MINYETINDENPYSTIEARKSDSDERTGTPIESNGGLRDMLSSFGHTIQVVSGGDVEHELSDDLLDKLSIGNVCAICLEEMDEESGEIFALPICNHKFHEPCVRRWKREKATCPECRGVMPEELGPTDEHIWIGNHQLTIRARQPPEPTCCYIFCTILQTPFGIVYALLVVISFAIIEFLALLFLLFFFIGFAQWWAWYEADSGLCKRIFRSITNIVLFPLIVLSVIVGWIYRVRILFCYLGSFYKKVVTCKCRWRDAITEILLPLIRTTQVAIQRITNENQLQ